MRVDSGGQDEWQIILYFFQFTASSAMFIQVFHDTLHPKHKQPGKTKFFKHSLSLELQDLLVMIFIIAIQTISSRNSMQFNASQSYQDSASSGHANKLTSLYSDKLNSNGAVAFFVFSLITVVSGCISGGLFVRKILPSMKKALRTVNVRIQIFVMTLFFSEILACAWMNHSFYCRGTHLTFLIWNFGLLTCLDLPWTLFKKFSIHPQVFTLGARISLFVVDPHWSEVEFFQEIFVCLTAFCISSITIERICHGRKKITLREIFIVAVCSAAFSYQIQSESWLQKVIGILHVSCVLACSYSFILYSIPLILWTFIQRIPFQDRKTLRKREVVIERIRTSAQYVAEEIQEALRMIDDVQEPKVA